jgi:hypothetical protein
MAGGGIGKIIKELEDDVVQFVEKEVHELEGVADDGQKSVYSDKFMGDVLGKHDPYGEDNGDHEAHASESSVPNPDAGSEWFPATPGVKGGTKAAAKQGANDQKKADQRDPQEKQKTTDTSDGKKDVADGTVGSSTASATQRGKKQQQTQNPSAAVVTGGDGVPQARSAAKREVGQPAAAKAEDVSGEQVDTDGGDGQSTGESITKKKLGQAARAEPTDADNDGAHSDDTADTTGYSADSVGDNEQVTSATQANPGFRTSVGAARSNNEHVDRRGAAVDNGAGDGSPQQSADVNNDKKDANADETPPPEEQSVEDVEDSPGLSPDSPQAIEREAFRKKAPSLVADLRDLAQKGKKAKEKKEVLRGIRRTLEAPHKLYRDPKRLIAARSGDPQRMRLSLKRHGRSVEPIDDSDPQDIAADPIKLQAVRTNHRLAIRHMIDMGQQYGKDPFDGIDPADVQAVVEHHVAEHPHRKHKTPYRPPEDLDVDAEQADNSEAEEADRAEGDDEAERDDEATNSASAVGNGDGSSDDSDQQDEEDSEYPDYPRLADADSLDTDDSSVSIRSSRSKKKKRKYPRPYRNDDSPNDLQLAAEPLSRMAANAGDETDISEDTPVHKKRAHAAKKMLKCVNRLRSFQQDPLACEGAFIDEAVEDGADVAGLSADEIEGRYYALKKVSTHYQKKKKNKHRKHRSSESDDYKAQYDGDDEAYDEHSHKKKHHHHKHREAYSDDDETDDYASDSYDESEISDVEMNLPQNQFPDTTVTQQADTSNADGDDNSQASDDTGDNDSDNGGSIFDQIGDTISSIFGGDEEEAVEDVEGAVGETEQAVQETEQAVESVEGAVGEAEQTVQNVEGAVQETEQAVEGVEGAVGEAEQAAEGVEAAAGEISQVEGELSEVESIGSEAEAAAGDIEEMENAEGEVAGMLNFCSNPMDKLTNGNNVLAGVGDLSDNPDDILNSAESLISGGQGAVDGVANGSSSGDIFGSIMGFASQIMGGGNGDDGSQDGGAADDSSSGDNDLLGGVLGMVGQFMGGGNDSPDPAASSPSNANSDVIAQTSDDAEAYPEEFANADLYGDEYN